jgi:hypothetical protein
MNTINNKRNEKKKNVNIENDTVTEVTTDKISKKKTVSKSKKITFILLAILIIVGSIIGITYAIQTQQKEQHRQEIFNAYWSIKLPDTINYNEDEQQQYEKIVAAKNNHFETQDLTSLNTIQEQLNNLDESVKTRIENELTEKYNEKTTEINNIKIVDGANDQEAEIFNTRKNNVLKLVEERKTFEEIDNAINTLKDTNKDIESRKENDRIAQEQANRNTSWTGGGTSGNTGGGSSSNGGQSNNGGGNNTPAPIPQICTYEEEYTLPGGGSGVSIIQRPC